MTNQNVKVTKDKVQKTLKDFEQFRNLNLLVGIPESDAARSGEAINNAVIGYIAEYGSPANNIPPRPWLLPSISEAQDELIKIISAQSKRMDPKKGLELAGIRSRSVMQNYLNDSSNFEPLSKATLAARERQGFKGIKPLIRTGQFRNSVNYVVVEQ